MEKSLSLYKLVNGQPVPFPSASNQITVAAFVATYQRMGGAPNITATVMHPTCLDGQWKDVFVTFRDERFFVKNEPSSEKDNTDERYSHSVTFVSERQQLDEVYMIDAVQEDSDVDGYKSNDTKILFMGDIAQWAARLNDALAYSGLYDPDTETGYHVVIDSGITSEDVLVSFEDKFISEALQEGFKAFDIPYYFVGKTIHFGYVESTISSPVEYGSDKELLRVGRENANIKLTNRCSGYGSSENIPYYYPNKTPLGDVSLNVSSSATVSIRSMERLGTRIGNFPLSYGWRAFEVGNQVAEGLVSQYSGRSGSRYVYTGGSAQVVFEDTFVMNQSGLVSIQISAGNDWSLWEKRGVDYNDGNYGPHLSGITDVKAVNVSTGVEYSVGSGVTLPAGEYKVKATVSMVLTTSLVKESPVSFSVTMHYACTTGSWLNNVGNAVDAFDLGLTVSGTPAIGDTVALNVIHRMEAITRLMPPIFRSTDGAERFYNALNDTYPHPDGGYYEFENEYSDSDRRELIQEFPDIKPTITGIKNAANQRVDKFIALAWDTNDNDEVDENGNYIHPYFFAKLAKTNGTYGFNLFDCATDSAMVVSFTSGICGACKFEIGVDQDTKKNTVQVDANGNLLRDAYGDVRCGREGKPAEQFLESQQDTSAKEVWIALKKDNTTYPVIMPSVVRNLKPTTSDTFVLLNIILPYGYITAAEDRLKDAIIEYMASVNSPMFNPSVGFSRVFLEENPIFLSSFNENALLPVKYNNRTESFYVSTFTYTMSSGEILPEISVDLISKITATSNSLQTKLDAVKDDILKAVNTRDFMQQALLYFLRKDIEDTASERITFLKGAYFGRFSSGDLGSGGAVQIDTDGNSLAEVDYLKVRKKATFAELVVDKEKAVEGDVVITPAATVIVRVETHTGYYRCFFQKTDNDGNIVYNPFVIGDLARCQTFNLTNNKYYWRKVVGVGQDYIDLSTAQGEYDGSDIPEAGDNVVQLGNVSDTDRQSAITLSSYGTNSPSMKMYHGINSFSLSGKDMYGVEYDPSTGYPRFYNYGAMRLGAREGEDGSFISYDNVSKQMNIKAIVNFLPQSTGLEQLDAYQKLVQIAQGNIETWFHDGVSPAQTGAPTMSNYPVNTWESEDYESHVGDIYYSNTGKGYRFKKTGSTYSWEIISDSELAALSQQVQGLQYLKAATNEGTLISGGLVLTSMIQLGYTDTSDVYHVMSGINGIGSDQRGIAAWFGGPMVDKEATPTPAAYASTLFRFDGTGYLAKGNITWDANGYGQVGGAGNNYAVKWDANGVTLGNGIKLGSSDETLASLLDAVNRFSGLFTKEAYTEGGVTKYRIKANYGLYSDSFISAGGFSSGGGGGGGGGSIVSWNQLTTGGTKIATISIDGVSTDVYAPATATWDNISGKPSWIGSSKPSYAFSEITGTASASQIPSLDWSKIATGKPTTLSGYGITDAKIVDGVITLGSSTITPLTSHQSLTGLGASLGAASNALTLKNQSGTALSTITAANLVTVLGNTPVNRATADANGNNIADTYETKTQVDNKVITAVSLTTTKLTLTRGAGNLEANVPTWNQNTTGNAASATKLATARNIWGQSFNGTDAISGDMSSVGKITFTAKTSKATSGNVLEVVTIDGHDYLHTTLPFFSDESVSAGGIGTGGGGGGTDVSWTNGDANYGVLTIAGNAHNVSILGHTHPQYMLASAKGAANGVAELGADSKIPLTQLPDIVMGQLMYGGTVNASNVATLSANVKTKLGISSSTVTLTNGTGTYGYTKFEGVYFIMSADSSFASLDLKVGDWLISTGTAWKKIDNTDAVTGVKGQNQASYQVGNVSISWDDVKPSAGVAKTELASGVQTSLGLADGALQKERFNVLSKQSGSSLATCDDLIGTCGIFRMGSKADSETPDTSGYGNLLSMFVPNTDTYAQIYLGYYNDASRNIFFRSGRSDLTSDAHRTWHHVLHDGNFVAGTDYLTPSGTAANSSKLENHPASYFAGVSLGNIFTNDNYFAGKVILGDSGSSPYLVGGDAEPLTIHGINGITIENDNADDYGLSVNTPAYFDSTIFVADEVTAVGFKVGSETGFLKANGTVDDNTYLTAHQPIYAATFSAGSFSAKTYNPKSAAQTINIPTTTSHISEGTNLYFTDARAISACSGTYAKLAASNTFTAANTFSGEVSVKSLTITETSNGAGVKHLAFSRNGFNYITVPSGQTIALGYDATGSETVLAISSAAVAPYSSGSYKDTTTLGTATTPWQAVYGKTYYADCTNGTTILNAKLQNGTTYSIMGASSNDPSGWTGWTTPGVMLGTNTANTSLTLRSGGTIHTYVGSSTVLSLKRSDSTTAGCYIRFANNATTNPYIGYFGVYKSGTTIQYRWYKYSTPSTGDQEVTKIAHLDTDGNFVANGQVTAGTASDLRFKKNIESLSRVNAESILAGLRPVEFDWNELGTTLSGNKGHDTGLIAQEVLGVFPYAVSPIYERYMRVDYAKLTPILVAGWQSHETRIEKLERENEMLKEEIKRLRS